MGKVRILIVFILTNWLIDGWLPARLFSQITHHASLQMNDRLAIPFEINYQPGKHPLLNIINGQEVIEMKFTKEKGDSVFMEFPEIAGQIIFHKATLNGRWNNLNKLNSASYPLIFYPVEPGRNTRFDFPLDAVSPSFAGIYDVTFSDSEGDSKAIGMFEQAGSSVCGTFRTETGDYRYLSGGVFNGSMKLSCFDGVHAFLFEAHLDSSESVLLHGDFYSGSKYHASWIGRFNPYAQLSPANTLSWAKDSLSELVIRIKTTRGKEKTLDKNYFAGTPTVIQIMGTWCPNCLDESKYFIELSTRKPFSDVRFVAVGFENGLSDKDKLKRLRKYQKKMRFTYRLFLGGGASTKDAQAVFNQLNGVFAFPTTIYLDKSARIIQVNSGFDGPATGLFYTKLQEETEELLLKLLRTDE